jgi:hypothetical protein
MPQSFDANCFFLNPFEVHMLPPSLHPFLPPFFSNSSTQSSQLIQSVLPLLTFSSSTSAVRPSAKPKGWWRRKFQSFTVLWGVEGVRVHRTSLSLSLGRGRQLVLPNVQHLLGTHKRGGQVPPSPPFPPTRRFWPFRLGDNDDDDM